MTISLVDRTRVREDRVLAPFPVGLVFARVQDLVLPSLRKAVDRLPASMRGVAGYHSGGTTTRGSRRSVRRASCCGLLRRGGSIAVATATAATVYLAGEPRPLDLTVKAGRLLAESAALVTHSPPTMSRSSI
jgi:hypothetical protein